MTTGQSTSLKVSKFIQAKRSRVFQAWTDPALMKLWYAPGDMKVARATAEPRVGGSYLVEMSGQSECAQQGEPQPLVSGTYQKVVQDELLVFTWNWRQAPNADSVVTVEFRDRDGGTEVTLTHERLPDAESTARHTHGWTGCLENLAIRIGAPAPARTGTQPSAAR